MLEQIIEWLTLLLSSLQELASDPEVSPEPWTLLQNSGAALGFALCSTFITGLLFESYSIPNNRSEFIKTLHWIKDMAIGLIPPLGVLTAAVLTTHPTIAFATAPVTFAAYTGITTFMYKKSVKKEQEDLRVASGHI